MEIREYPAFNADEIRRLYSEAGWTAYTEDMQALEQGLRYYNGKAMVNSVNGK